MKQRKILHTNRYGAGWTSWAWDVTKDQKRFMLEYQPFIQHLEAGLTLTEKHPLADLFVREWNAAFPGVDVPCLGGIPSLVVKTFPAGTLVRIEECEGEETVHPLNDEWL